MAKAKVDKFFSDNKSYYTGAFNATFPTLDKECLFNGLPNGKHDVKFKVDPKDPRYLAMKKMVDEAKAKGHVMWGEDWLCVNTPFSKDKDKDGNLSGDILVKFVGTIGKFKIVDNFGRPVKGVIWGGSEMDVAYSVQGYNVTKAVNGIKFKILGIKMIHQVNKDTDQAPTNPNDLFKFDSPPPAEEQEQDITNEELSNAGYTDDDPF